MIQYLKRLETAVEPLWNPSENHVGPLEDPQNASFQYPETIWKASKLIKMPWNACETSWNPHENQVGACGAP